MKKLPVLVALLFSLSTASTVLAAGYGAAGCGWGGKVIGNNNDILAQLGATILNGVSSNQTFAMTSGTSGCSSAMGASLMEQNVFVENNYNDLAKEMAAGEGESLDTLAGLVGCPTEQTATFAAFTKENYDSIFASDETTPTQMLVSLKEGMAGDPTLAASCYTQ